MIPDSMHPRTSARRWPARTAILRPSFSTGLAFTAATLCVVAVACSDEGADTPPPSTGGAGGSPTGQSGSGGAVGLSGSGQGGASSEGPPDDLPLAGRGGGAAGGDSASGGTGGAPPTAGPLFPLPDVNCDAPSGELPGLTLTEVATGLARPLFVTQVPGDDTRLYILEQPGRVRVVLNGELQATPFLDFTDRVLIGGNNSEQGALGLAFHPSYLQNGLFYVYYTANDQADDLGGVASTSGAGVLSEFRAAQGDPNTANADSERRLIVIPDTQGNHNGGILEFGNDRFLYVGVGDGGGGDDMGGGQHPPEGNGQSLTTLFGKVLRIDVDGRGVNNRYGIPPGNMGAPALPEIWAYGLRNPWRFSFDRCNGDLYIGDVGDNGDQAREEIDFQPASAPSGLNYGWRCREADIASDVTTGCVDGTSYVEPVAVYTRPGQEPAVGQIAGNSVTGGYVYRGDAIPALRGAYLYGDFASADYARLRIVNGAATDQAPVTFSNSPVGISSFGTDNHGELYVASFGANAAQGTPGVVYRIAPAP
jgi:glucose/arabinose dehydrogenase